MVRKLEIRILWSKTSISNVSRCNNFQRYR